MKKILVPTDFSTCAEHATVVALGLAKEFKAELHFYHRILMPPRWQELSTEERLSMKEIESLIKSAEEDLLALKSQPRFKGITVKTVHSHGNLIQKIEEYIDYAGIDFVVMGSHGASGMTEILMGSNAQKVVRFTKSPVLVVKKPVKEVQFKNIVFASNFNEKAKPIFEQVVAFAKHFEAHIHLLNIETSSFFTEPKFLLEEAMASFEAMYDGEITSHIFQKNNLDKGIEVFSKQINADLIAVASHGNRPLRQLFWHSVVEAIVNHSDIPVLSINAKGVKAGIHIDK